MYQRQTELQKKADEVRVQAFQKQQQSRLYSTDALDAGLSETALFSNFLAAEYVVPIHKVLVHHYENSHMHDNLLDIPSGYFKLLFM